MTIAKNRGKKRKKKERERERQKNREREVKKKGPKWVTEVSEDKYQNKGTE